MTEIWHKSTPNMEDIDAIKSEAYKKWGLEMRKDVFNTKILIDVDSLKKPNRCPICGERDYGREMYDPPI